MTLTQDIYYTSEFKKTYETNYNFNIPLDVNIDIRDTQKIKFKLIDFSMMNSMLNISSYHKNNYLKVVYNGINYNVVIPDGSYTASILKDWLNTYFISINVPIIFDYNKSTNKFSVSAGIGLLGTLFFYPQNSASLLGFNKTSYQLYYLTFNYSETFANMLPYSKIIITSDLVFDTNTQNNFENRYSAYSGTGDIICWCPRDIPLFATINYSNDTGREIELANRNIKSIKISIINEYQEFILDAPSCFIHFQLITYDNTNWAKKIFGLMNDICYYLLSIYWKK